jgi:hypothetical protein
VDPKSEKPKRFSQNKYRRIGRANDWKKVDGGEKSAILQVRGKRNFDPMEVEEEVEKKEPKRRKESQNSIEAGLSEQPCEAQ